MAVEVEVMSDEFTKYHLNKYDEEKWPFKPAIHHFTGRDIGLPHDHPFPFTSFLAKGSMKERVYKVAEDGSWSSEIVLHKEGSSYSIEATHIHEIIELPEGECWTFVVGNPKERDWHFWILNEGERAIRVE